jgi:flavin reductase (DIM6/NTAB) family NADH-FMN oxidoreductase RutF
LIPSTLRALYHGVELRYLPVAMPAPELLQVKTFLVDGTANFDVTGLDMPASLVPLVLGIRESAAWPHTRSSRWRFEVRTLRGMKLGSMTLVPAGRISVGGVPISLFRPKDGVTTCVTGGKRMWHYLLAWRRTLAKRGAPGLSMTFADLRALDVYYQRPRPVWLVTVAHVAGFNMFPMDLLELIDGAERLFLALRSTSPSIPFMRERRSIALSAVAADLKPAIYALGRHHRAAYSAADSLPFETVKSATEGLPIPAPAFMSTEWRIRDSIEVGSHTCFIADRINETVRGSGSQLAHISQLLAIRLAASGTPLRVV